LRKILDKCGVIGYNNGRSEKMVNALDVAKYILEQ
jgi:hypothetical protein